MTFMDFSLIMGIVAASLIGVTLLGIIFGKIDV